MGKEADRLTAQLTWEQHEKFDRTAARLATVADMTTADAAETLAKAINAAPVVAGEGVYLAARKVATGTVWTADDPDPAWLRQIPSAHQGTKATPVHRAYAPHCDQSILHAPGECQFCDDYPDYQEYRKVARINYTGHADEDKAPCPSEHFRPGEVRDRWPGNVAAPEGQPVPSYWPPELLEAINMPGSYQLARDMVAEYGTDEDQRAYAAAMRADDSAGVSYKLPWHVRAWARIRMWASR